MLEEVRVKDLDELRRKGEGETDERQESPHLRDETEGAAAAAASPTQKTLQMVFTQAISRSSMFILRIHTHTHTHMKCE